MTGTTNDSPIYLASTSPRRAKLLREAGIAFEAIAPPFDDAVIDLGPVAPHRAAEMLAYAKATAVGDTLAGGIVIGSDTVLAHKGRTIGKPRDRADAHAMLRSLFGTSHEVITGVAICDAATDRCTLFHDRSTVVIQPPPEGQLRAYLDAGEWRGKAGGYNLAELEDRWRFEVTGDPTTVVGLPMRMLVDRLASFIVAGMTENA